MDDIFGIKDLGLGFEILQKKSETATICLNYLGTENLIVSITPN